jgi:CRISPR system Cascade subunit CasA
MFASTLPGVFAALTRDEVESFPKLRPHQRHAWHSFLTQIATLALLKAGRTEPPGDEASWAELLRGLTPDYPDDQPWSLVTSPDRPALLQPPVASLAELKTVCRRQMRSTCWSPRGTTISRQRSWPRPSRTIGCSPS